MSSCVDEEIAVERRKNGDDADAGAMLLLVFVAAVAAVAQRCGEDFQDDQKHQKIDNR